MLKKILDQKKLKRQINQIKKDESKKSKILPLNKSESDGNSNETKKLNTKRIYIKEENEIETSYDELMNSLKNDDSYLQKQQNQLILNSHEIEKDEDSEESDKLEIIDVLIKTEKCEIMDEMDPYIIFKNKEIKEKSVNRKFHKITIDSKKKYKYDLLSTTTDFIPKQYTNLKSYYVIDSIITKWQNQNKDKKMLKDSDFLDKEQLLVFSIISQYKDLFYSENQYSKNLNEIGKETILDILALHCINHVLKYSEEFFNLFSQSRSEKSYMREDERIKGYTRLKVLILVPMQNTTYDMAIRLIKYGMNSNLNEYIEIMERLSDVYGPENVYDLIKYKKEKDFDKKPFDYQHIFYGKFEDELELGINFNMSGSMGFFKKIEESDIWITSPFTLNQKINNKTRQIPISDYLSSIEILIIYRLDVILMQNWQHLLDIFKYLNKKPKKYDKYNQMQMRPYFVNDESQYYRQTILVSPFVTPEMNYLFSNKCCYNHNGAIRTHRTYNGIINDINNQMKYIFLKYHAENPEDNLMARLDYFKNILFKKILKENRKVLIFISNTMDYLSVKKMLEKEKINFLAVDEYKKLNKKNDVFTEFKHTNVELLLYTERRHFYYREKLRGGIQNVVFYTLPEYAHYFSEIANRILIESNDDEKERKKPEIICLFSKFSFLQLERIIGTKLANCLLSSSKESFVFF